MVSVHAMLMEAVNPINESVPCSLKVSSSSPVAAEEENIFTIVRGTSSPGNPIYLVKLPMIPARKSRNPDARRIPTAIMSPTNVGIILITVKKPLLAPLIKTSYTFTFIIQP